MATAAIRRRRDRADTLGRSRSRGVSLSIGSNIPPIGCRAEVGVRAASPDTRACSAHRSSSQPDRAKICRPASICSHPAAISRRHCLIACSANGLTMFWDLTIARQRRSPGCVPRLSIRNCEYRKPSPAMNLVTLLTAERAALLLAQKERGLPWYPLLARLGHLIILSRNSAKNPVIILYRLMDLDRPILIPGNDREVALPR